MEWFWVAVVILLLCAAFDLIVGVSNDAVNFLNSAFGSRVAPRHIVLAIACVGIICGVTFSSGMMEIARKGIFNPWLFTMPELITVFLAVMITDIILLDMFNTFGMPTSTTVSIVFELLGAAIAASVIKVYIAGNGADSILTYINTNKALIIISGILLSVVVAFFSGAIVQFLTRMVFSFDYLKNIKKFGAIWGGIALAAIVYFILIKGAKGSSFIDKETLAFIKTNKIAILASIFAVTAIVSQFLIMKYDFNIFKPIVLVGTFALAMAFAANDLVNFIGVPLAGLHAVESAFASADPLNLPMTALNQKVRSETIYLLIAGVVMVLALLFSKKARTVTETEINLSKQDEGLERFESFFLSRIIVRSSYAMMKGMRQVLPSSVANTIRDRTSPPNSNGAVAQKDQPAFDLVRASVNLVVASAVISYATSMKLPLSTTYVTFMVAMGTSFSDRAWGSESAVYRVTGVLAVVGGWFMTAFVAFSVAFLFTIIINQFLGYGVAVLLALALIIIRKTHKYHKTRSQKQQTTSIFIMDDTEDSDKAVETTFDQTRHLIAEIQKSLMNAFDGMFTGDLNKLRQEKRQVKQIQIWVNAVISNIFKSLRLLHTKDEQTSFRYAQSIRRLQKLMDAYRDITLRSYDHVRNGHDLFNEEQQKELKEIKDIINQMLEEAANVFGNRITSSDDQLQHLNYQMEAAANQLDHIQIERIRYHTSRTRQSVLYYALIGDAKVVCRQIMRLIKIYKESFPSVPEEAPKEGN